MGRHASRHACERCGKRATFRLLIPDKGWEYACDYHARYRMQAVWDRFGLVLTVHSLREEGTGAFL